MSIAGTVASADQRTEIDRLNADLPRLQTALNRYCLSLTSTLWEADDLAQEAWLKALDTLRERSHPNAEALLLRIAKNAWIDQGRKRSVHEKLLRLKPSGTVESEAFGTLEIELALTAVVKHLSPLQRTVFLLRDVIGCSISETAARLRTTEGAVKAAHHRARQSLSMVRAELQQDEMTVQADDGLKTYIRALAAAYQQEDLSRLAELAMQDVLQPVTAIGIAHSRLLRQRHNAVRPTAFPTARLAA